MATTPTLMQAAQQIVPLSRQFQAVIDLAAVVGGLGSIEQAQAEAQARLDALRADVAAVELGLKEAQAAKDARQDAAAKALEAAQAEAAQIVSDAKSAAQAAQVAAQAAARARADAAAQAQQRAAAKLAETESQIQARTDELATLTARIDQARAAVAQMLGAAA